MNTLEKTSSPKATNYPLVFSEEPFLRLAIIYNPFDLTETTKYELVYDQDKTLADYMVGIPTDTTWSVAVDGNLVEASEWSSIKPKPFANIALIRVPEGGGGKDQAKSILRVVAIIALTAIAGPLGTALGGAGTFMASVISAAVVIGGSMVINALLPPPTPGADNKKESPTYGIDGAKNTAEEGVTLSRGYGEFRVAGNIVDFYTRNVGRDQYLFMRTALNDGEIESIDDIEINGLPITDFEDVQVRKRLGTDAETPNEWFAEATRMTNVNLKVDETFQERPTQSEVDRIRVDFVFPTGLYSIDQDDGATQDARTVTLELEYAACDQFGTLLPGATWADLPLEARSNIDVTALSYTTAANATDYTVTVQTGAVSGGSRKYSIKGQYRPVGTVDWIDAPTVEGTAQPTTNLSGGSLSGALEGLANLTWPKVDYTFHLPTPGEYEVRVIGTGAAMQGAYGNGTSATDLTIRDKTTKAKRLSYESISLDRGYYKLRVRRTTPQQTVRGAEVDYVHDEVWLTDIAEIDNDNVALNGIANLSIRAKVSEQISGPPNVTALCKLSKVTIYDEEGTPVSFAWSDNPADIVADILHSEITGAGYPTSKMLWGRYAEFREHCVDNGYAFNGVFDTASNLWDAVQSVARVGHGRVIGRGTKFSFAIDRAEEPVMIFTPSNMFKDTFKKTWVGLQDRANEVQIEFADAADSHKSKTIRVPNQDAFNRGEKQKIATVSGLGITNVTQAVEEVEYHIRNNLYIRSAITFDAPLEAIGLNLGDVALIQHDSVEFNSGVGGRLESGSTSSVIKLDRPVTMETGQVYSLLTMASAINRYTGTLSAISGNKLTITVAGMPGTTVDDLPQISRLRQGTLDTEVLNITRLSSTQLRLTLADTTGFANGSASLWDTDVIEERDVVTVAGDSTNVTVTSPFTQAPEQYTNFLFGKKSTVKLPYRLRNISGDDQERRTLSFVQYDSRVYQPGSWGDVVISSPPRTTVNQVTFLFADFDRAALSNQERIPVTLNWAAPENNTYGYGGAVVFLRRDDGTWETLATVRDDTQYVRDFSRTETPMFKVVAFDRQENRARFSDAPITVAEIKVVSETLSPPTNPAYTVPFFRTEATANVTWDAAANADTNTKYRVEVKALSDVDFTAFQAAGGVVSSYPASVTTDADYQTAAFTPDQKADVPRLDVAGYAVRLRTERGYSVSPWVYLPVEIETPAIPDAPTNLKLNNAAGTTFTTRDAHFAWDDIITTLAGASGITDTTGAAFVWKDYEVRILTTSDVILRTEYTRSPNYVYTHEKNAQDSLALSGTTARRAFKIQVRLRGLQDQVSNPATLSVSNATPAATTVLVTPTATGAVIRPDAAVAPDVTGMMVWASTTSGFTPGSGNLVYSGSIPATVSTLPSGTLHYYRWAFYDDFDASSVTVSGEASFSTLAMADVDAEFADALATVDELGEALLSEIVASSERYGDAEIREYSERLTRITDQSAIMTVVNGLATTVAANRAAYDAQVIVFTNADTALSSSISTLSATVSGHTVTIGTHTTAIATVGQVYGSAGFTVNANGNIAGIRAYAGSGATDTSGVIIEASEFKIRSATNPTIQPLVYDAILGKLKLNSVVANEMEVNSLKGEEIKVSGQVKVGEGDNTIILNGSHSTKRAWAGNSIPENAPFTIGKDGEVILKKFKLIGEDGQVMVSQAGQTDAFRIGGLQAQSNTLMTAPSIFGSVVHLANTTSVSSNAKATGRLGDNSTVSIKVDWSVQPAVAADVASFPSSETLTVYQRYSTDGSSWGAWTSVGSQVFTKITSGSPTATQYRVVTDQVVFKEMDSGLGYVVETTENYARIDSPSTLSFTIAAAAKNAGYYEYCVVGGNAAPWTSCSSRITLTDTDTVPSWIVSTVTSTGSVPFANPTGAFKRLRIGRPVGGSLSVSAAWVVVSTPEGLNRTIANLSTTPVLDTLDPIGLNKLDTGSVPGAPAWIYIWAVSNGTTDGTVFSLSMSAPSLSGYRYSALIGVVRWNGAAIVPFIQRGNVWRYIHQDGTALDMASGNTGGSLPTNAVSISSYCPYDLTTEMRIFVQANSGVGTVAPNNTYGASNSLTNKPPFTYVTGGNDLGLEIGLTPESTNIYWCTSHSSWKLVARGFILDI